MTRALFHMPVFALMIIDDLGHALSDLTKRYVICCRVRKVSAHFSMELEELYENALSSNSSSSSKQLFLSKRRKSILKIMLLNFLIHFRGNTHKPRKRKKCMAPSKANALHFEGRRIETYVF